MEISECIVIVFVDMIKDKTTGMPEKGTHEKYFYKIGGLGYGSCEYNKG